MTLKKRIKAAIEWFVPYGIMSKRKEKHRNDRIVEEAHRLNERKERVR